MNQRVTVGAIRTDTHGQELVDKLLALYPQGLFSSEHFILGRMPIDDPIISEVERVLDENGVLLWDGEGEFDRKKHYTKRIFREYSHEELLAFPLLQLTVPAVLDSYFPCTGRDGRGFLMADLEQLPFSYEGRIASTGEGLVVSDSLKTELESSDLKRVCFKPIIPKLPAEPPTWPDPSKDWKPEHGEVWWELCSDWVMPRLSMKNELRFGKGGHRLTEADFNAVTYGSGIYVREEHYAEPELRYDRQSLDKKGAGCLNHLDIALTYERFQGAQELLVTPGFYQFCIDAGVKAQWVPVHIDEE